MKTFLLIVFLLLAVALQHLAHEYAHLCAAKSLGIKVLRIQWLTHHWGTRVFFEHEPFFASAFPKKWAVIAGAGYTVTNCIGYILTGIYPCLALGWAKAFLSILGITFLLGDGIYFVVGGLFDFGDIVGVRKALKLSKKVSVLLAAAHVTANALLVNAVFY